MNLLGILRLAVPLQMFITVQWSSRAIWTMILTLALY